MAETVGELLRKTRLAKKLSLETVQYSTRIKIRYLEALENDLRDEIPSNTQARGFLRLYAGYLDLEIEPILVLWDANDSREEEEPVGIEKDSRQSESSKEVVEPKRKRGWLRMHLPKPDLAGLRVWAGKVMARLRRKPSGPKIEWDSTQAPDPVAAPITPENDDTSNPSLLDMQTPERSIEGSPPVPVESGKDVSIPSSLEIFQEIGSKLRSQRVQLGLSLSDVERFTHVRQHNLNIIEDGKFEELPSLVQARGMLNNYAKFLELDADEILGRFADGLQVRRLELAAPDHQASKPQYTRRIVPLTGLRRFLTVDLMVGGSIVIILFAFSIWSLAQVTSTRNRPLEPTAPPLSALLQTTPSATGETIIPGAEGLGTPTSAGATGLVDEGGIGIGIELTPTFYVDTNPIQVYIVAVDRAWLRITADGTEVFNKRIIPGNAYPFSANDRIELNTGNAGALQVFFNQRDLGILGITGQVVTVTFTRNGVSTPTVQFSPTPTASQEISETPTPTSNLPTPTVTLFVP